MNWLQQNFAPILSAIIGVMFGGLAGNIYAQWRTDKRNAKQKILRDFVINRIHKKDPKVNFNIAITEDGKTYQFENLYSISIQITNKSNVPYPVFDLLINLPETYNILKATPNLINRARAVEFRSDTPDYSRPLNGLDLDIKPLNRGDVFSIDLLVYSTNNSTLKSSELSIETRSDVEFVTATMFSENVQTFKSTTGFIKEISIFIASLIFFGAIADAISNFNFDNKTDNNKDSIIFEMNKEHLKLRNEIDSLMKMQSSSQR